MPGISSGEHKTGNDNNINKGNAMNYLALIVRIVHVCVEKQSAVKPHDANGGKEEDPVLIGLPYPQKSLFIF